MALVVDKLPDLKVYTKDSPILLGTEFKTFMIDIPHKTLTKTTDVQYSVTWTIPRNDTSEPMVYTFELYVNDEPSGMLATVTVLAREDKTIYDKVTNFWVSPDVMDYEGGVATFNISLRKVLLPHLKTIPVSLALQAEEIIGTVITSDGKIFLSSEGMGTLGYHKENKTFVNVCPYPLEFFFETSDGILLACGDEVSAPGLYIYNDICFEKRPPSEVSGAVLLVFENSDNDIIVVSAPDNNTIDIHKFNNGTHTFMGSIDTDSNDIISDDPLWKDIQDNYEIVSPGDQLTLQDIPEEQLELIGDITVWTSNDPPTLKLWDGDELYTVLDLYCPHVTISRNGSMALLRSDPMTKVIVVSLR